MTEIIEPSNDDKNIATMTHLGGTLFSFLPALIVWLLKKDDNAYIAAQAKEALNFQITVILAQCIAGMLAFLLVGLYSYQLSGWQMLFFVLLPPSLQVVVKLIATRLPSV